jgi:hypothetical protein
MRTIRATIPGISTDPGSLPILRPAPPGEKHRAKPSAPAAERLLAQRAECRDALVSTAPESVDPVTAGQG